jgi:hypothetical protein
MPLKQKRDDLLANLGELRAEGLKQGSLSNDFSSFGNSVLKIMERNGFDNELMGNLQSYSVKLPKFAKHAQILKKISESSFNPKNRIYI